MLRSCWLKHTVPRICGTCDLQMSRKVSDSLEQADVSWGEGRQVGKARVYDRPNGPVPRKYGTARIL